MVFTALFAPARPTFTVLRVRTVHPKDVGMKMSSAKRAPKCRGPKEWTMKEASEILTYNLSHRAPAWTPAKDPQTQNLFEMARKPAEDKAQITHFLHFFKPGCPLFPLLRIAEHLIYIFFGQQSH